MSQKSQVKIWEAPCVIPTNKVYPPEKSPLFIEKRAYQGNTGKFSPPLRGWQAPESPAGSSSTGPSTEDTGGVQNIPERTDAPQPAEPLKAPKDMNSLEELYLAASHLE